MPPLGCFSHRGEKGVTLANSTECLIQRISYENRPLQEFQMGVVTPNSRK